MMTADFTRFKHVATQLAQQRIAALGTLEQSGPLGSAAAAAKLLLAEDPGQHQALREGFDQLAQLGASAGGEPVLLADPAGHRRAIYHPLALHLHLAAFSRRYESLPVGDWGAIEQAIPEAIEPARQAERYADVPPPIDQLHIALWHTLCLTQQAIALGRDIDLEFTDGVVHQALDQPGDGGALHPHDPEETLDTWTWRELTGLHALANLALLRRNRGWARRVEEIALFHQDHTQPDYTTAEPWALLAFAWSDKTRPFAEQQLHDAASQSATTGSAGLVGALLLADAADQLAQFD